MKYLAFSLFLLLMGCDLPRDAKNSYPEAQQSGLRVGVVLNPPFTKKQNDSLSGIEIEIIREMAEEKNLEICYLISSESNLMKQLEAYRLHLLIGGFNKKTLWRKKAGVSLPYDGTHVFLVAKGENKMLFKLESYLLKNREK